MKKKLFLALAIAILLCVTLVACAPKPKKLYETDYTEGSVLSTIEAINGTTGMMISDEGEALILFEDIRPSPANKFIIFNARTGSIVQQIADLNDTEVGVSLYSVADGEGDAYTVYTEAKNTETGKMEVITALHSADGKEIASHRGELIERATVVNDLVIFDNKAYRVDKDTISYAFDASPLSAKIPECDYLTDEYNYVVDDGVWVYDDKYNLVSSYQVPTYADDSTIFVLENGNIFVQYLVKQPSDAKSYDIVDEDGEKFTLTSLIVKAKNGKTSEKNLKYMALYITNEINSEDFRDMFNDKVDNCAVICEIEDKRIDLNAPRTVTLKNSGRIDEYVDEYVSGQATALVLIADNRFIAVCKDGKTLLLDERGEKIGDITNAYNQSAVKGSYILLDNKVYDLNLNEKLDLEEKELTVEYAGEDYIVLVKEVKPKGSATEYSYYLYTNGETKELFANSITAKFFNASDEYIVFKVGNNYNYYSINGTLITTSKNIYNSAFVTNNGVLLETGTLIVKEYYWLK